ncbi:MAG: hypothetical protein JWM05_369, partial [Acidimicrobiales bacterium]|nr:hypothetical protein [Acidimicrobiales bacterium]
MADPTEHPIDADPPAASGRGWAGLLGFAAVVVFVAVLAVGGIPCGFLSTGDTPHLAAGTSAALDCIRHGTWTRCGTSVRGSSVHEYPLLQYLPAAVFRQLGLNTRDTVRALAWVNLAAFAALLLLLVRATRR